MHYKNSRLLFLSFISLILLFSPKSINAKTTTYESTKENNTINAVFLSGIGCHNCAIVDPIIFTKSTKDIPNLIVFEYEIFKDKVANRTTKSDYFSTYIPKGKGGVPFLILGKNHTFLGRYKVLDGLKELASIESNDFPLPKGSSLSFADLDLTKLPGKVKIWTKNRILVHGDNGNNENLKKLLLTNNIAATLKDMKFKKIKPLHIPISEAKIEFENAVKIDDWILQWNGNPLHAKKDFRMPNDTMAWLLITIIVIGFLLSIFEIGKKNNKFYMKFRLRGKLRDTLVAGISLLALIVFFFVAKNISPGALEQSGYTLPLPLFTFIIALVDGFNPCNMFVLTCLLTLLIATSDSKKRLYIVALSFVAMVFAIYFLFMAAWLNVFKYLTFITPLRITIAVLALVAGFINCKEFLFFKKGVSLMIPEKQQGPLMRRIEKMKDVIRNGSTPILISSSIGLATLASLVELPCTAGFPIIYTNILSGRNLDGNIGYYLYLLLYTLVYVTPLLAIITFFIYTFKAKRISQRQIEIIKFIGGLIMILLGIALLVNPGLIGLSFG